MVYWYSMVYWYGMYCIWHGVASCGIVWYGMLLHA